MADCINSGFSQFPHNLVQMCYSTRANICGHIFNEASFDGTEAREMKKERNKERRKKGVAVYKPIAIKVKIRIKKKYIYTYMYLYVCRLNKVFVV